MENTNRIEIIEEGVMQCSEPNFVCSFCNPIVGKELGEAVGQN